MLFIKGADLSCFIKRISVGKMPVQPDKILFASFDNAYSCNLKYIAEEITRRNLPVELVWVSPKLGRTRGGFPENLKIVRENSREMFRELASSKIWIDNGLNCIWSFMSKRPDQVYLNTWHGSMGIKRLSGDKRWEKRARYSARYIDYFLTNSTFEENVFHGSYWPDTKILPFGHPRNDLFFDQEKVCKTAETVRKRLGIKKNQKLLLYAPTFRDGESGMEPDLDIQKLQECLNRKFGGDWKILFRAHIKTLKYTWKDSLNSFLDVSAYPDMQELMAASDAGITDYSSWAYDYVLTGKPCFLYVYDRERYDDLRGLYYSLSETPFIIAEKEEEIRRGIQEFDDSTYQKKIRDFLKKRGCYEDGHAAERTVDYIEELLRNE